MVAFPSKRGSMECVRRSGALIFDNLQRGKLENGKRKVEIGESLPSRVQSRGGPHGLPSNAQIWFGRGPRKANKANQKAKQA
jgi:hypothetical protein